jgi:hypothetical protein
MAEPLKSVFFRAKFFGDLTAACKRVCPPFDAETFLTRIYDESWDSRELKERMRHTTLTLGSSLPEDYRTALGLLRQVAPSLDSYGFENMIFPDFVEMNSRSLQVEFSITGRIPEAGTPGRYNCWCSPS